MNSVGAEEIKELKDFAPMGHIVDHRHRMIPRLMKVRDGKTISEGI